MINSIDPAGAAFLFGLNNIQQREQIAQRQLTTGLRINSVSDAPDQIAPLMSVRAQLSHMQQIDSNLGRVKTETDSSESALENATKLMDNALTLGAEGQPGTMSADSRAQIAGQIGGILQQMVAISGTNVEGRYVFSGDSDQAAPYSLDLTQTNPVSAYGGADSTRQIQLPDGSMLSVSLTAQQIFDSPDPTQNVFNSLNALRNALLNNDQDGINDAIGNIRSSSTYLNTQLAFYGTAQNRIDGAVNDAKNFETQLQTQISGIEDADPAQAITDLQQATVQQQAALASQSKMPRTSLFDYLA